MAILSSEGLMFTGVVNRDLRPLTIRIFGKFFFEICI